MTSRPKSYDKAPFVAVPGVWRCVRGWDSIGERLRDAVADRSSRKTILAVECYPGVDDSAIMRELSAQLQPTLVVRTSDAMLPAADIEALIKPFIGGSDPVFGYISDLSLPQFFEADRVKQLRSHLDGTADRLVLVVGVGACHVSQPDILVYADLSRWEAQLRFRRKQTGNLGAENRELAASLKYKRAFFVDWRVCDSWKRPLIPRWDFVLDTHDHNLPAMADGEAVRSGLKHTASRPFRVVPFFDPAPWGGQWMKGQFELNRETRNYGWCFDCVPEENSLVLGFGGVRLEIPSIDLVFDQTRALLGERVAARFGAEFPIRFDFLDTVGGGNLSFQVHPMKEYIRRHFGMGYTQDESYYILDAAEHASVFLGLKEGVDKDLMLRALEDAQAGGAPFPVDQFVNNFPAKKHDHFLIPAGTVHCSGAGSMVLEISATPYIFTFKMWDWGRVGLDGKPRPIHLDHGFANIQWRATTGWVTANLINRVEPVRTGDGWREERTGLHESEFIETRRHWFTKRVEHNTNGGVHVLNLIEGNEVVVESPSGMFEPFVIHYAETFIVPAAVGAYTVRPSANSGGALCATIQASVRE